MAFFLLFHWHLNSSKEPKNPVSLHWMNDDDGYCLVMHEHHLTLRHLRSHANEDHLCLRYLFKHYSKRFIFKCSPIHNFLFQNMRGSIHVSSTQFLPQRVISPLRFSLCWFAILRWNHHQSIWLLNLKTREKKCFSGVNQRPKSVSTDEIFVYGKMKSFRGSCFIFDGVVAIWLLVWAKQGGYSI